MKINLQRNVFLKSFAAAAVICLIYVFYASQLKPIKIANLKTIDALSLIRSVISPLPVSIKDIVIISVDDDSVNRIQMKWPWSRAVLAGAIRNIAAEKPAVICLDFMFFGRSKNEEDDLRFAKAIEDAGNVIIASIFEKDGKYTIPEDVIARHASSFGFINKPRDVDNAVRRMRPFVLSVNGNVIDYSLPLKAAALFSRKKPEGLISTLPLLNDNTAYIPFSCRDNSATVIPIWRVLEKEGSLNALTGKMVFLGITSESFHDIYPTPLGLMSGLSINVNESISYLERHFFRYTGLALNGLILFVLLFAIILISVKRDPVSGIFVMLIVTAVLFAVFLYLFLKDIIIEDIFGILFTIFIAALFIHGWRYINAQIDNARLRVEAITDGLTGLYVYKYFDLKFKSEFAKALSSHRSLALIIYDIDHFKQINDTYGHEFGNVVLKSIARIFKENTKKNDTLARFGGEEFCIIASDTNAREALIYAERIRTILKHADFAADSGKSITITISAGIASVENNVFRDYTEMIKAADAALYRSKNTGRNKVTIFDGEIDTVA